MLDRLPVLIAAGQVTHRAGDVSELREPLDLMADAARVALADAETHGIAARVDSVRVVNVISARYADPAGALASRLDLAPGERLYTTVGGNSPQWLVNRTADDLAAGRIRMALLAGGEAMHTLRIAARHRLALDWLRPQGHPVMIGETRQGSHPDEWNHGAQMPAHIYPLFEIAVRARERRTPEAHAARLAALCASLARVAATNPQAWFRDAKTAKEIGTVSADNRMVAYPYPKYMNAIMNVDQAAAVIMTTAGEARALGVPAARCVYLHGAGECHDQWFIKDRASLDDSPAMAASFALALEQAGIDVGDLGPVDVYSCFAVAVEIAARALGFPTDGSRPLTVTGGLPYFGGPGNNYSMHAIATMIDRLRAEPDALGLVSGLGWYLTKHAAGVYGVAPPRRPWRRADVARTQREIDAMPHPPSAATAEGTAHVETYTVVHDREGRPESAIVVARMLDGRRVFTNTDPDPDVHAMLERDDVVGAAGSVHRAADGRNLFRLAGS